MLADPTLFAGMEWQVHKFGGTSVANAECFLTVASIIEAQTMMGSGSSNHAPDASYSGANLAIVVSAMGGKPKTTDLLLNMVQAAATRNDAAVHEAIKIILDKHTTCLESLFAKDAPEEIERLSGIIHKDLRDIQDILKTVALLMWQPIRVSELVSGYGELWSTQMLTALLRMRAAQRRQSPPPSSAASTSDSNSATDSVDIQQFTNSDDNGDGVTHEFVFLDARRVIIVDEDAIEHGAVCWDVSQTKLQDVYEEAYRSVERPPPKSVLHFVMTGYVASNTHGVATTLQRDGSDYSAAILGRLLQASAITIWTDVDGVLSADPRRVPRAYVIPDVSYNEAMELAYFGAKVIHPKTMQPAISANPQIPIYIRNTFNAKFRGTRIYVTATTVTGGDSDRCVCGFSSIEEMALINVEGSGMMGVHGVAKRMFGTLEQLGVNVVLISQASSEHSITFACFEKQVTLAKEAIEEEFRRELAASRITNIDVKKPCSIIAAVGDGMQSVTGVAGKFFSALGAAKINVLAISQGCSERNISAVVMTEESTRALRAIHAAFRLSHATVRVAIVGASDKDVKNELGDSLLKLLEAQRNRLRETFAIDLQICCISPNCANPSVVGLTKDDSGDSDSITFAAYTEALERDDGAPSLSHQVSFQDFPEYIAKREPGGLKALGGRLYREECTHHVLFDCTGDAEVGKMHAGWLRMNINVVTANSTGLAGPKEQRDDIFKAEKAHGKLSACYLREVTVGGALPVISTLHSLLDSGDRIRRMDGILSVSLSYILFRVSPPPNASRCSQFDELTTNGIFRDEIPVDEPCKFSEAVREAIALGLMEEDPTKDLKNEYTAQNLMVLAQELGYDPNISLESIKESSEQFAQFCLSDPGKANQLDYKAILEGSMDQIIKDRVDHARQNGLVLRHVASVDVRERKTEIKIVEVPSNHVFASTPPSCECVRFFTHRHRTYPLVIQGPSAGADSTASALLAELLSLMREQVGPRRVLLSRTDSSAALGSFSAPDLVSSATF